METVQADVVESVEPIKPAASAGADGGSNSAKPKKKNHTMALCMALMAVAVVCAIGFGVWAMIDGKAQISKRDEQIAGLNRQLTERKEVAVENDAAISDDAMDGDIMDSDDVMDIDAEGAKDYVYVVDWGLKIKVPDNLEVLTYMYDHVGSNTVLKVSGATREGQAIPDFASISKCVLGVVERFSRANVEAGMVPDWYPSAFMSEDDYDYYYIGPQMLCTEGQRYASWEQSTVDVIREMLTQPSNYSKI